jgi:hypothetical protein
MVDSNNPISLTVTKFPHNLIIPNIINNVSMQIRNTLNKEAEFKFAFEGENLKVDLKSSEFSSKVKFGPNETKNANVYLTPLNDGIGKLIINAYWLKLVEQKVKVQKLRENVSGKTIKKILKDKKILPSIVNDFDVKKFFNSSQRSDIKKLEKDIKNLKSILKESTEKSNKNEERELNNNLKELAKSYLSIREFYKALEIALEISDKNEQLSLYYNLIRAYSVINFEESMQVVAELNDKNMKDNLIKDLAIDFALVDLQKIDSILNLVDVDSFKLKIVIDVIGKIAPKNVQMALKLFKYVSDDIFKLKILFNFIQILYENQKEEEIPEIVQQITELILDSPNQTLIEANSQNLAYNYLKDAIYVLAEVKNPEVADSAIKNITRKEIRDNLEKDLFDDLYIMVDEIRTKIEPTLIFSQYYSLNVYTSKISSELQDFASLGGNVSNNVLTGNFDFNFALVSLFSLNFSIFPFIDRIYSELNHHNKKSFAYYIYPTINNHDEEEQRVMQRTLTQFFPSSRFPSHLTIFNLDFIPYLGQPTIIISGESDKIKLKIQGKLSNKANILIDQEMFEGGKSTEFLKEIFQSSNIQVINLVLSYEFINDYNIFKELIESLI